jgi:hypothetical protein
MVGTPEKATSRGYVHPTFWRRSVVQRLLANLEERLGKAWQIALSSQRTLSEYTLYGIFAEELIGVEQLGLYSFNEPLMHLSWDYDLRTSNGLEEFFRSLTPESYAMMFHSQWRAPVDSYEGRVRRLWDASPSLQPHHDVGT